MSNRRESIKKSLGITEYPWSSDDEETENTQAVPELHSLRQHSENDMNHSNAADGSETNAQTPTSEAQSQASARRNQLFWSLALSNPTRMSSISLPRNRLDMPLSLVSRQVHSAERGGSGERSVGRSSPASDVQRILAFRKMNRQLSNYRANRAAAAAAAANLYTIPRNNSGRSNRDSVFSSPSVGLATDVTAIIKARSRRSLPRTPMEPIRNAPTLNEAVIGEPQASSSGYSRRQNTEHLGNVTSNIAPVNLDHSDDETDMPAMTMSTSGERNEENMDLETAAEGGSHNVSAVTLEEEIVEIDVEPEADPAAETNANEVPPPENNTHNELMTVPAANTTTAIIEHQPHGVKRKRESVDENAEPCSVREFNQSLLRLLECPVCLEWMEPPMSQCRRGHLVCGRCRARLASCPVCRTAFSSVRNRAMEGVAEMLRYPCRHGCGRDLRLRRRGAHEASCAARRYRCPAPVCAERAALPHHDLAHHFQSKHLSMVKIGRKHKFSMKVNSEQHDNWVIMALHQLFHLRVDVDIRTWGVVVYVAYIGPKCNASQYTYEVTVIGQHNSRKLVYTRATHCDLECSSLNVSRQDCFHLTLDQALNFLRVKNRHCEPDKFLNFNVEITHCETIDTREDSDS